MLIDTTQVILNYENVPMYEERIKRDAEGKTVKKLTKKGEEVPVVEEVEMTLRSIIRSSLLGSEPDKVRGAEDKNKADQILRKVFAGKKIKLTTKQAGYIIEKVGIFWNPLVLGRVEEIFDGKDEEDKEGK